MVWLASDSENRRQQDTINDRNDDTTGVNHPPIANVGGTYFITYGHGLTLNASASPTPIYNALTYSWTINGQANAASDIHLTLSWSQLKTLDVNAAQSFMLSVTVNDGQWPRPLPD